MYKICLFVPGSHLEEVKSALFNAGAGKQGGYENCCWQSKGVGQFRPAIGSKPFVGVVGVLEKVDEYKVEMLCERLLIKQAVESLKQAHPYEEPAFEILELVEL